MCNCEGSDDQPDYDEKELTEHNIDKFCFFCDKRRESIILINDTELQVCGDCEYKLFNKLKV